MNTISKEYLLLFNTITNTLETLEQLQLQLLDAQRQAEALYIAGETSEAPPEKAGRTA